MVGGRGGFREAATPSEHASAARTLREDPERGAPSVSDHSPPPRDPGAALGATWTSTGIRPRVVHPRRSPRLMSGFRSRAGTPWRHPTPGDPRRESDGARNPRTADPPGKPTPPRRSPFAANRRESASINRNGLGDRGIPRRIGCGPAKCRFYSTPMSLFRTPASDSGRSRLRATAHGAPEAARRTRTGSVFEKRGRAFAGRTSTMVTGRKQ